jgi:hypothetical protein
MSNQTKEFLDSINVYFDEMETRIRQVREAVAAAMASVTRAVPATFHEPEQPDDEHNRRFQQDQLRIIATDGGFVPDAGTESRRWKASQEAETLAHHAGQNEQYALVFIVTALFAINAAEAAALDALHARLTADEIAKDGSAQTQLRRMRSLV